MIGITVLCRVHAVLWHPRTYLQSVRLGPTSFILPPGRAGPLAPTGRSFAMSSQVLLQLLATETMAGAWASCVVFLGSSHPCPSNPSNPTSLVVPGQ